MKSSVLGMTLMSIVTSMGLLHPLDTHAAFINYGTSITVRGEVGNSSGIEDSFYEQDIFWNASGTVSKLGSVASSTGHLSATSASTTTYGADGFSFSGSSSSQATIDESSGVLQIASSDSWFQWEFIVTEYTTVSVSFSGLLPEDTSISSSGSSLSMYECDFNCWGSSPLSDNSSFLASPGITYVMYGGLNTEIGTITTSGSADANWSLNVTGTSAAAPEVPIPAAAWLFGSGLLGLIGVARRKKA